MFALAILVLATATQFVFSWNSAHDLNLPAWPSWTIWDAVDNLWLPMLFLAGVGLRERAWLLMPAGTTACVAALAAVRVPEDRWLQDRVWAIFVVVAAAGTGLMKLGQLTARAVEARTGTRQRVALTWTGRVVGAAALTAVVALGVAGRLDDVPEGPRVTASVQRQLGPSGSSLGSNLCYQGEPGHSRAFLADIARGRRIARRRFRTLIREARRNPSAVLKVAYYSSDSPLGPGPLHDDYTVRELADETVSSIDHALAEPEIAEPGELACYRRARRDLRAALD